MFLKLLSVYGMINSNCVNVKDTPTTLKSLYTSLIHHNLECGYNT